MPGPKWEHVSARSQLGVPRWEEMCWLKDQFWEPGEWVVQFHPAQADHINTHGHVLHLWRCPGVEFPVPPKECV
jgi:hypothetical protein